MKYIKKIFLQLLYFFQLILLLFYIILEELVWEQLAKPIYHFFLNLKLAIKFENFLKSHNRYIPLVLFLSTFVFGELLGLLTPIFLANGLIILAFLLYFMKILIVAFAFWLFKLEKERLLSFFIINYLYEKIIYFNTKIKSSKIYKTLIGNLKKIKNYLKAKISYIKKTFF